MQIIYILFEKDSPFFHTIETLSACLGVFVFLRRCLYLIMCKNVCLPLSRSFYFFTFYSFTSYLLLFTFPPFSLYFFTLT